ncbi:dockerin type I domain-containing protein [uncultured Ruminococcus sp.]|uniref:dockerin type I domain-containing protein n=1 Tax=uncultured Ruminococcus sp. TaxID=165186 RepID=UPI0025FA7141|nr:dockerin type I domain-containing protein [uncultured Ruminococcus sp.]
MAENVFAESSEGGYELITNGTKKMTLSDVKELAKKGADLSWADFGPYEAQWSDTGAFCTCFITLEDGFCLSVGGNPAEPPTIVWFYKDKAINGFIDIRKDDIDAFIQKMTNNEEQSGSTDSPSSYQLPEIEYTYDDIFAMTTEEVVALFAEKGLTQEKGYYVYGQGDDAEYVFPHLWEVLIFSDAYLSDQTVEELLKKYPPMDNGNQLYCSGNSIWNEQMIKSSLALPEEYFDYNVFEDRLYVNEKGSTKKSSIACDCIIRCTLTDKKEYAAARNAALNYLQLRSDFDSLSIDGEIPYYGKEKAEKSAAQKLAEEIAEYMDNNSIHGITCYSDKKVGISYPEEYDTQVRVYVAQLDTEGVDIDFDPHGPGYDFSGTLTIDDYAAGIQNYMNRNSLYGFAEVYKESGVKKIRVVVQKGDYAQMTEYISGLGLDESLIKCVHFGIIGQDDGENMQSLKGDANGNKLIDAVDASIILANYAKYSTSSDKPAESELAVQDVNGDGFIDAVDASSVLTYYAYVSVGGNLSFSEYLNDPKAAITTTTAVTTTTVITTITTTKVTAKLSGELIPIPNDRTDMPVIRGISLAGSLYGSEEFNSKKPSLSGIRCIFGLEEEIIATLDTDTKSGIIMYIFNHKDDQSYYETANYSMPIAYGVASLKDGVIITSIGDGDGGDDRGYYDMVFVYDGTAFAKLYIRVYYNELINKSDAELEKLMHEQFSEVLLEKTFVYESDDDLISVCLAQIIVPKDAFNDSQSEKWGKYNVKL